MVWTREKPKSQDISVQQMRPSLQLNSTTQPPRANDLEDILTATGLLPISKFSEKDIFIVGYPKSGNTWFQCLVAGVVYGVNASYEPDSLIQALVPDVHAKQYYKRYNTPTFFKSHELPNPEYKRVIYLLRDGRDAMVSYFHYNCALVPNEQIDFMEMVRDGKYLFPCKWHEHVQRWLQNPFAAGLIKVKYEDLKADPLAEMRRLCDFAGLKRDDDFLESAVAQACFDAMRKREIRDGWEGAWPKDKPFVRRGKVGSYQDEMPEDVLKCFLNEASMALRECGYVITR